jgi:hypothetical protein
MTEVRRCKNCVNWDKRSNKFGKCPVIGRTENIRFAYREGVVFAMTPQFAVCNQHKFSDEEDNDI